MKRLIIPCLAMLAGASAALARPDDSPQARLDRALAGRTAGAPVDCLQIDQILSTQIIDGIGILYEGNGGVRYLNRPTSGAFSLRTNEILVTDTHSPQLCSIDTVRLVDSTSHFPVGFVGLGKFIPYPRPSR
jgi:hypothetical protein